MDLSDFFRGDIPADPELGLQELLRAILMRTQFNPGVRHAIGWRGLKQSSAGVEGWTARIRDWAGVFGLHFEGREATPGWYTGNFGLCYFPDPDEELVERCSLLAAAHCQRPDYLARVRSFLLHPELMDLFGIGRLFLSVTPEQGSLCLGMESFSAQRVICSEGVRLERDGCLVEIIAPNGRDRDFPAFEVTSGFFDVLAASVTYILGQPPISFTERRFPGWEMVIGQAGESRRSAAKDIWCGHIVLGYGEGLFDALCIPCAGGEQFPTMLIHWIAPQTVPPAYAGRPWWTAHLTQHCKTLDKNALGIDDRPPLILLTGFLGSGKTSFLQHFIEYQTQRSRFVAIIQNEIGAVGLDGKLLDYTVTEIDEGCVCCSLSGSLNRAVRGMLSEFHPDAVIVETTGLANPLNLLEDMSELEDLVRFDCTLTVVDAINIEQTLSEHPLSADQIRAADVLMLNKKDLVSPARLDIVTGRIRQINPHAPLFLTVNGELNPALILDADDRPPRTALDQPLLSRHCSHLHEGLWSKSIRILLPIDRDGFLKAVVQLSPSIFRAKGILEFSDSPQPILFQYVAGRYDISVLPCSPIEDRYLTLIGKGGDLEQAVSAILSVTSPEDS